MTSVRSFSHLASYFLFLQFSILFTKSAMKTIKLIKKGTKFKRKTKNNLNCVEFLKDSLVKCKFLCNIKSNHHSNKTFNGMFVIVFLFSLLTFLSNSLYQTSSQSILAANAQDIKPNNEGAKNASSLLVTSSTSSPLNRMDSQDQTNSNAKLNQIKLRSSTFDRKSFISAKLKSNKQLRKLLARPKDILSSFVPHILTKQLILKRPNHQANNIHLNTYPLINQLSATMHQQHRKLTENIQQQQQPLRLIKLQPFNLINRPIVAPNRPPFMFKEKMQPSSSNVILSPQNNVNQQPPRIVLLKSAPSFYQQDQHLQFYKPQLPLLTVSREPSLLSKETLEENAVLAVAAAVAGVQRNKLKDQENQRAEDGLSHIDEMIKEELDKRFHLNEKIINNEENSPVPFSTVPSVSIVTPSESYLDDDHDDEEEGREDDLRIRMNRKPSLFDPKFATPVSETFWRNRESGQQTENSFQRQKQFDVGLLGHQRNLIRNRDRIVNMNENSQVQFNDTSSQVDMQEDFKNSKGLEKITRNKSQRNFPTNEQAKDLKEKINSRNERIQEDENIEMSLQRDQQASFVPSPLKTIAHLKAIGHQASPFGDRAEQSRQRSVIYKSSSNETTPNGNPQKPMIPSMNGSTDDQEQSPSSQLSETLRKLRETKARIRELQAELNQTAPPGMISVPELNISSINLDFASNESNVGGVVVNREVSSRQKQSNNNDENDWFRMLWSTSQGNNQRSLKSQSLNQSQTTQKAPLRQQEAMNLPLSVYHKGPLGAPARLVASAIGRKVSQKTRFDETTDMSAILRPTSGPIVLTSTMTVEELSNPIVLANKRQVAANLGSSLLSVEPIVGEIKPAKVDSLLESKQIPAVSSLNSDKRENIKVITQTLTGEPNLAQNSSESTTAMNPLEDGKKQVNNSSSASRQQVLEKFHLTSSNNNNKQIDSQLTARKLAKSLHVVKSQQTSNRITSNETVVATGTSNNNREAIVEQFSKQNPIGQFFGSLLEKISPINATGTTFKDFSKNSNKLTTEKVLFILITLSCSLATLCLLIIAISLRCQRGSRRGRCRRRGRLAMRGSSLSATCATGSTSVGGSILDSSDNSESPISGKNQTSNLLLDWRPFASSNKINNRDKLILDGTMRNISLLARNPLQNYQIHPANVTLNQQKLSVEGASKSKLPAPTFNKSCCHCVTCSESWLFRADAPNNRCSSGFYHPVPRGKLPFGAASSVNKLLNNCTNTQRGQCNDSAIDMSHIQIRNPVGGTRMRMMQAIDESRPSNMCVLNVCKETVTGSEEGEGEEEEGEEEEEEEEDEGEGEKQKSIDAEYMTRCNCKAALLNPFCQNRNQNEIQAEIVSNCCKNHTNSILAPGENAPRKSVCSMRSDLSESLSIKRCNNSKQQECHHLRKDELISAEGIQHDHKSNCLESSELAGNSAPIESISVQCSANQNYLNVVKSGTKVERIVEREAEGGDSKIVALTGAPSKCEHDNQEYHTPSQRIFDCLHSTAEVSSTRMPPSNRRREGCCQRSVWLEAAETNNDEEERSHAKGKRLNSVFNSPISLAASIPGKLKRTLIGQQRIKTTKSKQVACLASNSTSTVTPNSSSIKLKKNDQQEQVTQVQQTSNCHWAHKCSSPSVMFNQRL